MMQIINVPFSVLQFLREKIIIGELKPGQKLNELSLSADLAVSRPPLREALRILEKDHLARNVPRKGTYVTDLSIKDFVDISQTREMIECFSIDLFSAANLRTLPEMSQSLHKALNVSPPEDLSESEELLKFVRILLDFHTRLVESAGNSLLTSIYRAISFSLARYQFIYFRVDGTAQHSLTDHKKILELLENGDYEGAKAEMRKHLRFTVGLVKNRVFHASADLLDPV